MTDLAKQYQKKTDKQHILDNPDTYIGSIENVDERLWIYDEATLQMTNKEIHYIPGLYKLYDEGVVNCRDHVIRMIQKQKQSEKDTKLVTYINIDISEDGTITMENDGNGIDVAKHPEYNVWIPQMIFGELRTSTNYDKDEKRIVGGKNGFGFKLVLIWSSEGSVETFDHIRGLKYVQTFTRNLDIISEPVITKMKGTKPYTKVSFKPDYRRFGISNLTPDMIALMKKRFYDICAVTDQSEKKIKFAYNGAPSSIKNFQQYIDLYIASAKRVYEASECGRWEYAVALAPNHEFTQVMPTSIFAATRWARCRSRVQIAVDRPYFVSLALAITSASESKGLMWQQGPKISSRTTEAVSGRSVQIVGCTQEPLASSPGISGTPPPVTLRSARVGASKV